MAMPTMDAQALVNEGGAALAVAVGEPGC